MIDASECMKEIEKLEKIRWGMILAAVGRYDIEKFIEQMAELEKKKCLLLLQLLQRTPEETEQVPEYFSIPIRESLLTIRTINCFIDHGFLYLGDILCDQRYIRNPNELQRIPNFGKKSQLEFMQYCTENDYKFQPCNSYRNLRIILMGSEK